ncbi:hypothetical protein EVAR_88836_1 [Eumeta japonica]|uniref:Uncharacterized protein n=1 Tax=Eumeta variegata TaxID=151549 RepID=A0A4C1Y761_EUMVA|nr:hypothetical protein EVAR_88836_1 [Eumeta japonica]
MNGCRRPPILSKDRCLSDAARAGVDLISRRVHKSARRSEQTMETILIIPKQGAGRTRRGVRHRVAAPVRRTKRIEIVSGPAPVVASAARECRWVSHRRNNCAEGDSGVVD